MKIGTHALQQKNNARINSLRWLQYLKCITIWNKTRWAKNLLRINQLSN